MVLNNRKIWPLALWIFLLGPVSCSSPVASQQQLHLADAVWNKYNNLELTLPVPDTSAIYHAYMDIRITRDYPYSYLSVVVTHPGKKTPCGFL